MLALALLPAALVMYMISWIIYTRIFHPYSHIPGPFFASVSSFWLLSCVLNGRIDKVLRRLHNHYGPVIRIAPDEVSISDPKAVDLIYGVKSSFPKTDFYDGFDFKLSPNGQIFTLRDETLHTERRKIAKPIYTSSNILEQEEFVDACLEIFDQRMTEFAKSAEAVDLGKWLWMFTFDVIGELFFGQQFGFMEKKHDHEGWMETIENFFPFNIARCILPNYLRSLVSIAGLFSRKVRKGIPAMRTLAEAGIEGVAKRQIQLQREEPTRQDMLAKAFSIYEADLYDEKKIPRQKMLLEDLHGEALVAIAAGSETTAIAMRAILYNILTHPHTLQCLLSELATAESENRLSRPYIRYSEALKLPYVMACCKEGMRLHPSIAHTFPRQITGHGVKVGGTFLPAGYKAGISPAVLQYNRDVFGADAEQFRPERWLGKGTARMEHCMMNFGAGKRQCIGMNIALIEIYKLVPQFLRDFHVELTHPEKELRTKLIWVWKQYGFEVKVTRRREGEILGNQQVSYENATSEIISSVPAC